MRQKVPGIVGPLVFIWSLFFHPAAVAAEAFVSGTLEDMSHAPVEGAIVSLYACPSIQYELCNSGDDDYLLSTYTDSAGFYQFSGGLKAGKVYQVEIVSEFTVDHAAPKQYSAAFETIGGGNVIDLTLKPYTLSLTDMSFAPDVVEGTSSNVSFTLRNNTTKDLKLDAWLFIYYGSTGSAWGSSQFEQGNLGKAKPLTIDLLAAQSLLVSLPFTVAKNVLSGSSGYIYVYVSKRGEPTNTYIQNTYNQTDAMTFRILPTP